MAALVPVTTYKIQKKIQIEGLLQVRKGGYETTKYKIEESGLELLRRRVGNEGTPCEGLGAFVKQRLRQEEESAIRQQLDLGL